MKIKINPKNISKNMYVKSKKNIICKSFMISLLLLVILVICFLIFKYYFYPLKYFDIVKEEASKNNIDPHLVMAVIKTESNFNQYAISNKEAKGLMQIMDSTANEMKNKVNVNLDISSMYNPNVNILIGCKYLSSLIQKYNGNYYLAVCAYNAGMGNVDKWIEQGIISSDLSEYKNVTIPFSQTKDYLYKVISSYRIYRKLYK